MHDQQDIHCSAFPSDGIAVVIGSTGAIGHALCSALENSNNFNEVVGLSRSSTPSIDIKVEADILRCAKFVKKKSRDVRLVISATGFLHDENYMPEKSWADITPDHLTQAFAVNTIGPALIMKHFLPLFPTRGKAVFVALSARVGSIGDNSLGGWYSYRASKAALNQLIKTGAAELKRKRRDAICIAIHPGTVDSTLSAPFQKTGLRVRQAEEAALDIFNVIQNLTPEHSGSFRDYSGSLLPW